MGPTNLGASCTYYAATFSGLLITLYITAESIHDVCKVHSDTYSMKPQRTSDWETGNSGKACSIVDAGGDQCQWDPNFPNPLYVYLSSLNLGGRD